MAQSEGGYDDKSTYFTKLTKCRGFRFLEASLRVFIFYIWHRDRQIMHGAMMHIGPYHLTLQYGSDNATKSEA